jgi:hypothetical protein
VTQTFQIASTYKSTDRAYHGTDGALRAGPRWLANRYFLGFEFAVRKPLKAFVRPDLDAV